MKTERQSESKESKSCVGRESTYNPPEHLYATGSATLSDLEYQLRNPAPVTPPFPLTFALAQWW